MNSPDLSSKLAVGLSSKSHGQPSSLWSSTMGRWVVPYCIFCSLNKKRDWRGWRLGSSSSPEPDDDLAICQDLAIRQQKISSWYNSKFRCFNRWRCSLWRLLNMWQRSELRYLVLILFWVHALFTSFFRFPYFRSILYWVICCWIFFFLVPQMTWNFYSIFLTCVGRFVGIFEVIHLYLGIKKLF